MSKEKRARQEFGREHMREILGSTLSYLMLWDLKFYFDIRFINLLSLCLNLTFFNPFLKYVLLVTVIIFSLHWGVAYS